MANPSRTVTPGSTAGPASSVSPGPSPTPPPGVPAPHLLEKVGKYRWTILALLFFATTINYVDRQVLGILAPTLQPELGWSEADYGAIVSWFSLAYGVGLLVMGRVVDRIGVRRGFAVSIVV